MDHHPDQDRIASPPPPNAGEDAWLSSPAMDLAFAPPARIGVPSAWYGHVPFAQWLIASIRPAVVVELGTHNGVSYAAFCEAVLRAGVDARCYAVDTWQGDEHAGFYDDAVFRDLAEFHDARYAGFSNLVRSSFDDALGCFADGSVDLLHIDGLHTYEAVRHDWQAWQPKLSARAVVMFHDTNERKGSFGVWRLWDELEGAFPSFGFLHAHGLGVLAVGTEAPASIRALCGLAPPQTARVRERFAQLGARWAIQQEFVQALALARSAEAAKAGLTNEVSTLQDEALRLESSIEQERRAALESEAAARLQAEHALARVEEDARCAGVQARAEAEAAASRAAAEKDRALERAAVMRADLNEAYRFQGSLELRRAELEGEVGYLQSELAARADDWERVHGVLANHTTEADRLRDELEAMRRSSSWQLTWPIRAGGRRLPGLGRRARHALLLARLCATGGLGERRRLRAQRQDEMRALGQTPLFDAAFYLEQHPGLTAAGGDPASHYAWVGAWQGALPNRYFDSAWYLAQNPGVTRNPLLHWIETGAAAGLDPNPFLSAAWYTAQHPEAAHDPLAHYIRLGAPQGFDPNPMLDARAYLAEYQHARTSGLDALLHWWHHGSGMGFNPHPLFDARWYVRHHGLPVGTDPLAHWLHSGRDAGLATSPILARAGVKAGPIRFATPERPRVSVIVPAYGHHADTVRCLAALFVGSGDLDRLEVLVADDNPAASILEALQRDIGGLRAIQNPENLGFLRSCNSAAAQARGEILVFLNNDTAVHPGWLDAILSLLDRDPRIGMVGCKLLNPDGTIQEAGGAMPSDGWGVQIGQNDDASRPEYNFVREVDVVVGACFAVRAQAWAEVGGFDEIYRPAFYEEFDLAFALRDRGWKVMYQPASVVDHLGSHSYGTVTRDRHTIANQAKFCAKWARALAAQPAPGAPEFLLRERRPSAGALLYIDDCVPAWDRHAGALTNRHYIGMWQELGYKVVFVPAADPAPLQPYTAVLQNEGVEVVHAPETLAGWLARHGRFVDMIWTARPDVTAPILDLLRRTCDAPILYYTHDLHYLREARRFELDGDPAALDESVRYHRLENAIFDTVDRVFSLSHVEAAMIRTEVPKADVHLIPPFLYPPPPPIDDAPDSDARRDAVLFVGGYGHAPNIDAARILALDIMPLVWRHDASVRLILAGSAPPPEVLELAGDRIEVPGFLADLAPVHARARLSVSPLRYGAGVKGKIVAALWEGVPVVTTSVGNEGLDLVSGQDALIGDTAESLAAHILALWPDRSRRLALSRAGQAFIGTRFTAEAAAAIMTAMVAAGRRPGTIRT